MGMGEYVAGLSEYNRWIETDNMEDLELYNVICEIDNLMEAGLSTLTCGSHLLGF